MAGLVPAIHAFLVAKQGVDARDKRGHDGGERRASWGQFLGTPALFENPLHLRAAAIVVAHQIVDRPAHILVAALLARLELVAEVGAVALTLPHDAGAERALLPLVLRKARLVTKPLDGIG